MNLLFLLGAILAGVSFAVQGPVNTALGRKTGALQATAVSFGVGTLVLIVIVLLAGNGDMGKILEAQLWQLIGGMYGAIGVCVTVMAVPVLGAALSVMMSLLGQIVTGGVIDAAGLFGAEPVTVSLLRVLGMAAVAGGIALIFLGSRSKEAGQLKTGARTVVMMILAFVSGIGAAVQSPTNASLAGLIGGWEATLVSFVVGFAVVIVVALIVGRGKLIGKTEGLRPWMFVGGALGVLGIFLNLYVVSVLGVALQVACGMMGQLGTSMVIDSLGLIGVQKMRINPLRIAGVAVISLGVVLVTLGR